MTEFAVFTIASKNFLAFVQALNESLQRYHPGTPFYCVLCDDYSNLDAFSFPFEIIPIDALGIPNIDEMLSTYNITELNTALKPFAFSLLFDELPAKSILYFDPDIFIYSELAELLGLLGGDADAVLIPHITGPAEYAEMSDREFLKYGIYNLGFCAFNSTPETRRAVSWWGRRLEKECVIDLANGLFVDQKWADLIPAFVGKTKILRHPGYNVAYWNLSSRKIRHSDCGWLVNGEPLRFFHFSGGSAEEDAPFSRHSSMFTMDRIGEAAQLVREYRRAVQSFGHAYYSSMDYAYSWNGAAGKNSHTPKRAREVALPSSGSYLPLIHARSPGEYSQRTSSLSRVLRQRDGQENKVRAVSSAGEKMGGYCSACARSSTFLVTDQSSDQGLELICERCKLPGTERGALQVLKQKFQLPASSKIFALGYDDAANVWLRNEFANVVKGDIAQCAGYGGADRRRLPYPDGFFDCILALSSSHEELFLLEEALVEICRVHAKGGALILSGTLFDHQDHRKNKASATLNKAERSPMEKNGEPLEPLRGDFGARLRAIGYAEADFVSYWSFDHKIFGSQQAIVARK